MRTRIQPPFEWRAIKNKEFIAPVSSSAVGFQRAPFNFIQVILLNKNQKNRCLCNTFNLGTRFLHDFCGDGRRANSFLLPTPSIKRKTLRTDEGGEGDGETERKNRPGIIPIGIILMIIRLFPERSVSCDEDRGWWFENTGIEIKDSWPAWDPEIFGRWTHSCNK